MKGGSRAKVKGNAFNVALNGDFQVVGEYTGRANLSTTPGGSTLTIGNI